ncbi:hypothetical protein EVAR_102842_1 [Eumeta japonica]|uniref:Uncharacterized protein n=1 Tax=Eumeta variegata TaxID=151549 RepID=A0A4C1UN38_EUMVA|nr:hypothetical protein EVAR_102842_1 [Eumeta japonica]
MEILHDPIQWYLLEAEHGGEEGRVGERCDQRIASFASNSERQCFVRRTVCRCAPPPSRANTLTRAAVTISASGRPAAAPYRAAGAVIGPHPTRMRVCDRL